MWRRLRTCLEVVKSVSWRPEALGANLRKSGPAGNREFVVRLVRHFRCRRVAEIGVWKGALSRMLLNECDLEHLYLVDPLEHERNFFTAHSRGPHPTMMPAGVYNCRMGEETLTQVELDRVHAGLVAELERCHPGRATFLRLPSLAAAALIPDKSLDFVFIDAIHLYEDVFADIAAWLPKLSRRGVLAGDDYTPAFEGVILAVNESIPDAVRYVHHETGVWYVRKKDMTDRQRR